MGRTISQLLPSSAAQCHPVLRPGWGLKVVDDSGGGACVTTGLAVPGTSLSIWKRPRREEIRLLARGTKLEL